MQRERQKGNRDFGNRHIALFLSLVLLILCLVPGCDTLAVGIGGDAGSDTAAVFDSFTRDLFIDLASQDELTLNYTLADLRPMGLRKQNRFSAVIHWKIRRRKRSWTNSCWKR